MSNPELALAESVSTTNASYFILVHIIILLYCCFGLAVVCDVYFVPALQKLSYTYNLPPDIAGSTLMALGASVPELFASLIGVFITKDDIGTGSIIGSSCFNLIAVPAACAFLASATFSKKLTISPLPVIRNSALYAITILVLLLIIKDNKVDIPEAIILLLFFVMYMAFMMFSVRVTSTKNYSEHSSLTSSYISSDSAIAECDSGKGLYNKQPAYGQFYFDHKDSNITNNYRTTVDERTPLVSATKDHYNTKITMQQHQQNLDYQLIQVENLSDSVRLNLGIAIKNSTCLLVKSIDEHFGFDDSEKLQPNEKHEEAWVSSKWILAPMFPLTLGMKVLAPCKFKNTFWTIWTFIVSIALIGGLTYISVWMVHSIGQTVGIPEVIAGMTILSWGTGITELIASIVLIKKTAAADMAVCNTIGSNIIDVSFCLGLPWMVKCIMNHIEGLKPEVTVQSKALPWTSFLLVIAVLLLILILKLHSWVLNFSVGIWLTLVYILFVATATYLEYSFSQEGFDLISMF